MPNRPPTHKPLSTGLKHVPTRRRASWTPSEAQQKAHKLRSSARWQRLQKKKIHKSPLCEHPSCGAGRFMPEPGEEVHHIIPIEQAPELTFKYDNLATLCKRCHSKITRQEAVGIDTTALFKKKDV